MQLSPSPPAFGEAQPASILYTMLPPVLKAHVPRLQSLRHALSEVRGRSYHSRCSSISAGDEGTGSRTPPPSYSSRAASASGQRGSLVMEMDESDEEISGSERPSSSASASPIYQSLVDGSGIKWKLAHQGTLGVRYLPVRRAEINISQGIVSLFKPSRKLPLTSRAWRPFYRSSSGNCTFTP